MKKYLFFISVILISCQEEITLDLPQAEKKLVVEGAIESGFPPYVMLTKNQGYFDPADSLSYFNSFVNNANSVKVWYYNELGEEEIKILEKAPFPFDNLPLYTDLSYDFSGNYPYEFSKEGRTYYLEIKWNNQVITSSTTIPQATPLDCLWVEKSETADKDFKYDIRAIYSDPADQQNNLLIQSKRLQHYELVDSLECEFKDNPDQTLILVDAGSDLLINGETFETYFPRPKNNGFPNGKYNAKHTIVCNNDSTFELQEDIVLIKFSQIDEPSVKFWRGLIRQVGTNGNPFAEPMNLVSNINNGLGVFTGYGSVYYKVPIIKDIVIKNQVDSLSVLDIF